jgi:peptidoglycan hydrolase CwlO-like protein
MEIPVWLSAIAALFVIAAALGSAVAIFRVSLAQSTIDKLRGDVEDFDRREQAVARERLAEQARWDKEKSEMCLQIESLETSRESCQQQIDTLQKLVLLRKDDAEIRQGIAELKRTVDEELRAMLLRIEGEVRSLNPALGNEGPSHA